MNQLVIVETPADIALAEHAAVIKALGKRVVGDVIEIGSRLTECKRIAGHGNWLPWLKREFGWSEDTAERFIQVGKLSNRIPQLAEFSIPVSGLYLLAAPSTPESARDAVLDLAANGKHLTHAQVKEMVDEARAQAKGMVDEARAQAEIDARAKAEHDLAEARKKYESEIANLRNELASTLPMSELTAAIEEQVQPLKDKIAKYESRLEKLKKKQAEKPGPENEFGLSRAVVSGALRSLASNLTITPIQMIKAQKVITQVTGQSILEGLGEDIAHAKVIAAWLERFIEATKELKK